MLLFVVLLPFMYCFYVNKLQYKIERCAVFETVFLNLISQYGALPGT